MIAPVLAALVMAAPVASERFEDVAFRLASEPVDAACADMELWVAAHAGRDDASRGLLWIARRRLNANDRAGARAALARATSGRGRFGAEATRLLAAMNVEDGKLDEALEGANTLAVSTNPQLAEEGRLLVEAVHAKRQRRLALTLCAAFLLLDVAVRAARTGRTLWPPPFEPLAAGPVLAVLAAVAWLRGLPQWPALAALAAAGTVLAWARGAHRRARPLALPLRFADAALAAAEGAALTWVVLEGAGVVDKLLLTLTAGPA